MKLYSTEQVTKYHVDKACDQISDAILTACLKGDPNSRVACECMFKGETVVLAGEITTQANINYPEIVHRVASKLGYIVKDVIILIDQQSPEIANGVKSGEFLRAGDQGIMFGYATRETESGLPYAFDMANKIIKILENDILTAGSMLCGDAKCQVTVDLDLPADHRSLREILVSVCHKPRYTIEEVRSYVKNLIRNSDLRLGSVVLNINPAGTWTLGGPAADCGLTGRKIVCDQYGGFAPVGGGAFSGKDPSKVDRSAAYMANHIARWLVQNYGLDFCEVQIEYAIGEARPMSVSVKSSNPSIDEHLTDIVWERYDLSPAGIIKYLDLFNVDYETLAEGCHYRFAELPKVEESKYESEDGTHAET